VSKISGRPRTERTGLRKEPLRDLLKRVGIDPTLFDVVIFGDGSGSGWDLGRGWAAVDTALNKFTDALSRLARLTLTKTNLAEAVEMVEGVGRINVYRRNP
jgi:hypothetical protein